MIWETVLYTAIALFSTVAGALTGMGGGVIMKPVMDSAGRLDAQSIGLLTSVTVLLMAVVSVVRQSRKAKRAAPAESGESDGADGISESDGADESGGVGESGGADGISESGGVAESNGVGESGESGVVSLRWGKAVPLGAGAAAGGVAGQFLLDLIVRGASNGTVRIAQNAVLGGIVFLIFVYMTVKHRLRRAGLKHGAFYGLAGVVLGLLSAFLGIGGGPMNVALLILLFGMNTKTAVLHSLVVILFSQTAKLTVMAAAGTFALLARGVYLVLPFMAAAGVAGAFLGSLLSKRMSQRGVDIAFNAVQVVVFGLCVFNIVQSLYV
ncbi:MAG: sulfite exporter TauE/SafE family protein [Clostridiales bacterium]|jgi:uncharacterized membrane protein YfcA|nr:sulfite exporter TauE/SafE family protein [Clostridiales bacterium]